jgi:hypothetical protein
MDSERETGTVISLVPECCLQNSKNSKEALRPRSGGDWSENFVQGVKEHPAEALP